MSAKETIGCYGELLLRASTHAGVTLEKAADFSVNIGGAEANVAAALSGFGRSVRFVGAVPDNAFGQMARQTLKWHDIDTQHLRSADGRMGLYFLETGAGRKPAQILYDRAGSVFSQTQIPRDEWDSLLSGLSLLHISGVTPAVSAVCAENVAMACEVAAEAGIAVSFDFNHRAKLWAAWRGDAKSYLRRILSSATILFANDHDLGDFLSEPPTSPQPRSLSLAPLVFAAFPKLELLATAERAVHTSSHHALKANVANRSDSYVSEALDLPDIIDRIGGGDAFAAGVLDAYLDHKPLADIARLGLGAAAYKHYVAGDAIHVSRKDAVQLSESGRADVKR